MLFKTHLAFAFLIALLIKDIISDVFGAGSMAFVIFVFFMMIGALLPDLDNPHSVAGKRLGFFAVLFNKIFGHRGITHGIWMPALLAAAVSYFWNLYYGVAIFIGYMSHVLIDGLTKQGINLLHPFSKLHISGFVETGSFMETVIFAGLLGLIVLKMVFFA